MSESRKIEVPEGMLDAAMDAERPSGLFTSKRMEICHYLEAALCWLSENPIVPTEEQWKACLSSYDDAGKTGYECTLLFLREWQCRIFLALEPEIPEEVKDLLWKTKPEYPISDDAHVSGVLHNEKVIEAFNRGRRLGEREP